MTVHKKRSYGFTLVELMIVVAIVGVLASVAIPAFQKYVIWTKHAEAPLIISEIQDLEIAFFQRPRFDSDGAEEAPCFLWTSSGGAPGNGVPTPFKMTDGFNTIEFSPPATPVLFRYEVAHNGTNNLPLSPACALSSPTVFVQLVPHAVYVAAIGDMDNNGVSSWYEGGLYVNDAGQPVKDAAIKDNSIGWGPLWGPGE